MDSFQCCSFSSTVLRSRRLWDSRAESGGGEEIVMGMLFRDLGVRGDIFRMVELLWNCGIELVLGLIWFRVRFSVDLSWCWDA